MTLQLMRRWVCRKAAGKVLEVSAGTGRNIGYYSPQRVSGPVTLVDSTPEMLSEAATKLEGDDGPPRRDRRGVEYEMRPGVVEELPFGDGSFDTVVETFGLCSCDDPVRAVQEFARVCKPGGRILLLEHGAASWSWLERKLAQGASEHARKWGCWWNRDIPAILEASGAVDVQSISRWHFGTTYVVQCSPRQPAGR